MNSAAFRVFVNNSRDRACRDIATRAEGITRDYVILARIYSNTDVFRRVANRSVNMSASVVAAGNNQRVIYFADLGLVSVMNSDQYVAFIGDSSHARIVYNIVSIGSVGKMWSIMSVDGGVSDTVRGMLADPDIRCGRRDEQIFAVLVKKLQDDM